MALMPVAEALEKVLAGVMPLGPEQIGLRFAATRTLAHAVSAALTNPPFDASAMDGYAVRAADIKTCPTELRVIGESAAGWPFGANVKAGEAVRIFTGAPVPDGADTVIIQEDTAVHGDRVTIQTPQPKGANIRLRGHDFHEGEAILQRGRTLNARELLLAAASGHGMLAVVRRPVVAILATGDELVEPSDRPGPGQIVASNAYGLAALVEAAGASAKLLGIAQDNSEDLANKIRDAESADILVTTGGASVGDHDLVRPALEAAGAQLQFYKIAMRPGKPTFFGTRAGPNGTQRIVGLPGNPIATMVGARVFLIPLIAALLGRESPIKTISVVLSEGIPANGPRDHYMRSIVDLSAEPPCANVFAEQDSAQVAAFARANALVIVPAGSPALAAGSRVDAMLLDF
jgi:molybdopterin molybdotransferase